MLGTHKAIWKQKTRNNEQSIIHLYNISFFHSYLAARYLVQFQWYIFLQSTHILFAIFLLLLLPLSWWIVRQCNIRYSLFWKSLLLYLLKMTPFVLRAPIDRFLIVPWSTFKRSVQSYKAALLSKKKCPRRFIKIVPLYSSGYEDNLVLASKAAWHISTHWSFFCSWLCRRRWQSRRVEQEANQGELGSLQAAGRPRASPGVAFW